MKFTTLALLVGLGIIMTVLFPTNEIFWQMQQDMKKMKDRIRRILVEMGFSLKTSLVPTPVAK